MNEPYPGTQAVLRAIALLKLFTDEHPERTLSDLSRSAALNKTTTFRLLTALESEGMVTHTTRDTYRLGPDAIVLGGRALRANDLRKVARPELERLVQVTRETASLEIPADDDVLILDEVAGGYLLSTAQYIGTRWPIHATSTGKVLLAYGPESQRERVLQKPLVQLTPKTITDPAVLRQQLAQVCRQGYATAEEELEAGYMAVAAPIYNFEGRVIAALSLDGPALRLTPTRLAALSQLVREAAGRVSSQLGFTGSS
jgi:DNA-binding IclR family transcriptional regulator